MRARLPNWRSGFRYFRLRGFHRQIAGANFPR